MSRYLPLFLACLVVALAACDKKQEYGLPKTADGAPDAETASAVSAAPSGSAERKRFLSQADREVLALEQKLEETRKWSQQASGETRKNLDSEMLALDAAMKDLKARLAVLKTAAADKWKDLKSDFESALDHLRVIIAKANASSVIK